MMVQTTARKSLLLIRYARIFAFFLRLRDTPSFVGNMAAPASLDNSRGLATTFTWFQLRNWYCFRSARDGKFTSLPGIKGACGPSLLVGRLCPHRIGGFDSHGPLQSPVESATLFSARHEAHLNSCDAADTQKPPPVGTAFGLNRRAADRPAARQHRPALRCSEKSEQLI